MPSDLTFAKGAGNNIPKVSAVIVNGTALSRLEEGFAKRIFENSDLIFEPSFTGRSGRSAARLGDAKALCLANFRVLGSDVERNIFDAATRDIARSALALSDVQVSHAETGAAWALGLRPLIFRELYSAYSFQEILKQDHKTITVVFKRFGPCEAALIARLHAHHSQGDIEFTGVSRIHDNKLVDFDTSLLNISLARVRNMRLQDDVKFQPANALRIKGDMDVFEGDNPLPSDVLCLHLTGNRMFHANIPPILDELEKQDKSAAILAMTDDGIEIYDGVAERTPQNIIRLRKDLEVTAVEQIDYLESAITQRMNLLASQTVGLDSLVPFIAANDRTYIRSKLSQIMVFHNAFNVILGRTKAQSLYMSQSPDTHPLAYLALSIGKTRIKPYYAFSAFVTEDTRSLPFISPAYLLAYGEHDRELISRRSPAAGSAAIVTGMPSLDKVAQQDNEQIRKDLISKLNLDPDKPILAIKTSRLNAANEDKWIGPFLRWSNGQDISVVLAENPRKGTKPYDAFMRMAEAHEWKNVRRIQGVDETFSALAGAHIVISDQPEHALAGLIAGRVFIHAKINNERADGLGDGTGFVARSAPELRDIISGVLLDEDYLPEALLEQRKRLQSLLHEAATGTAAQNVVNALFTEREMPKFENPFLETRLIDNNLQKLDIVPRVNLL